MTNPNDPAFGKDGKHWFMTNEQWAKYPGLDKDLQSVAEIHQGLTKREYFAAMGMQGIFAGNSQTVRTDFQERCQKAVEIADALIAELNKKPK